MRECATHIRYHYQYHAKRISSTYWTILPCCTYGLHFTTSANATTRLRTRLIANKIALLPISLRHTYMRLPKAWRGNDTKISMYSLSLVATQIQMMILSKHPNGALTYLLVITHYATCWCGASSHKLVRILARRGRSHVSRKQTASANSCRGLSLTVAVPLCRCSLLWTIADVADRHGHSWTVADCC